MNRPIPALALAALLLLGGAAQAQQVQNDVLASGERGRSYHDVFGANLVAALPAFRLKNRATSGSVENLELLTDGRAHIGFAQSDAYALRMRSDPERYAKLTVVGRLVDECIFVATRRRGPVTKLQDLGAPIDGRPARVAVGPEGSGMGATWTLLAVLTPDLSQAEVVRTGGVLSLNQVGLGMLDAMAWVSDPANRSHVLLQATIQDRELSLLPIEDPELEHSLPDGTPIYRLRGVDPGAGQDGLLTTLCTQALVFASADANPRLVEQVSQALSLKSSEILGRE